MTSTYVHGKERWIMESIKEVVAAGLGRWYPVKGYWTVTFGILIKQWVKWWGSIPDDLSLSLSLVGHSEWPVSSPCLSLNCTASYKKERSDPWGTFSPVIVKVNNEENDIDNKDTWIDGPLNNSFFNVAPLVYSLVFILDHSLPWCPCQAYFTRWRGSFSSCTFR